jgi:CRISPR-associated protein Cmr4
MTANLDRALLFLYAETPVHAGADTGLGALDLPIQREVTTGLPIIKGESLKGALREHLRPPVISETAWKKMFGAAPPRSGSPGGALTPGELRVHEAQIVAFPAPSLDGFAWVTSPLTRARLDRRARLAGITSLPGDTRPGGEDPDADADVGDDDTRCLMTKTSSRGRKSPRPESVVLGSYAFTAAGDSGLKNWAADLAEAALPGLAEHEYFRGRLKSDMYQVSDVAMRAITSECTVVSARVQLGAEDEQGNPAKAVKHGPFYSEYLPGESLLAALIESASADHLDVLVEKISDQVIQVGGDESIGKGLMWCRILRPGATQAATAADEAGR